MYIGVLTSSRADFGIYLPLLKEFQNQSKIKFDIIVFGSHLSKKFGETKNDISLNGFKIKHELKTIPKSDSKYSIAKSIGKTIEKFSTFWNCNKYDYVICLGDRYEMFAAVTAGLPFGVKFIHIHAGEKSLGAIDNVFRHSISLASMIHFTATEKSRERVIELLDVQRKNVYNVGALSLDGLSQFKTLNHIQFSNLWGIDLKIPTVLTTFHPETVKPEINRDYAVVLSNVILKFANEGIQFLITMPNADTESTSIRSIFNSTLKNKRNIFLVENLGKVSYFSALKHCKFLFGNTSSGIIEAASFKKYVLNIGDRQKGREHGKNVIHSSINEDSLVRNFEILKSRGEWNGSNIYYKKNVAKNIVKVLKKLVNE